MQNNGSTSRRVKKKKKKSENEKKKTSAKLPKRRTLREGEDNKEENTLKYASWDTFFSRFVSIIPTTLFSSSNSSSTHLRLLGHTFFSRLVSIIPTTLFSSSNSSSSSSSSGSIVT